MNTPFTPYHRAEVERLLDRTVRAMARAERAEALVDALAILECGAFARFERLVAEYDGSREQDAPLDAAQSGWKAYNADLQRHRWRLRRARMLEAACRRAYEQARDPEAAAPGMGIAPDVAHCSKEEAA
jgi:hypothetical protein